MPIAGDQIHRLIGLIADVQTDELDCDDCFARVSEFAEYRLLNRPVPAALKAVERHLQQCACCRDEYEALLTGLRSLADSV